MGGKNSFIFHIIALCSVIMQTNSSQYCIYIHCIQKGGSILYVMHMTVFCGFSSPIWGNSRVGISLWKEWPWAICPLKKSNVSDSLAKKQVIWQFFPFFMPKSESLMSLFAHCLLFKEGLERFAPVALYKRATWKICSGCW